MLGQRRKWRASITPELGQRLMLLPAVCYQEYAGFVFRGFLTTEAPNKS